MSYCFDVISRVYNDEIAPHVPDETLRIRFGLLLEALHEANHDLKDAVNHDKRVHAQVRRIEQHLTERAKAETRWAVMRSEDGQEGGIAGPYPSLEMTLSDGKPHAEEGDYIVRFEPNGVQSKPLYRLVGGEWRVA